MTAFPRTCAVIALLVLLASSMPFASAGGEEEERYSDFADATGYHTQKKMARGPDGSLWYAYVEPTGEANETDLVVVHGEDELARVKGARGDLSRPTLALAPDGALFLAWTERADEDREVFAARFVEGAWRDVEQLSSGEGYSGFPSLAAGPDGAMHIAWYGFDGDHYQTFYREWRAGAWAPARQLSSGPLDANNPSVVVARDGAVHVAWYKDEGRRYSVWHAARDASGAWGVPSRLPGTPGDALNVALAIDARGLVHATWDVLSDDGTQILHASLGDDGWSAPEIIARGADAGGSPAIAAWREGVLIAWADENGTLRGTDLHGPPRTLLDAPLARNPSLRGPAVGDPSPTLDILWAMPEDDGFEIALAHIPPECTPWALPLVCDAPVPLGGWAVFAALLGCTLARFRWSGQRR